MYPYIPKLWSSGCFIHDKNECNCTVILDHLSAGGIAEIYINDSKTISEGGNDCPSLDKALINSRLIDCAPILLHLMMENVIIEDSIKTKLIKYIFEGKHYDEIEKIKYYILFEKK